MAREYDNSNRISLWYNERRTESTHPHLSGSGETEDESYWVDAWFSRDLPADDQRIIMEILKTYDSKKPFLSIRLKPKQGGGRSGGGGGRRNSPPAEVKQAPIDFDDDIPF